MACVCPLAINYIRNGVILSDANETPCRLKHEGCFYLAKRKRAGCADSPFRVVQPPARESNVIQVRFNGR